MRNFVVELQSTVGPAPDQQNVRTGDQQQLILPTNETNVMPSEEEEEEDDELLAPGGSKNNTMDRRTDISASQIGEHLTGEAVQHTAAPGDAPRT